MYSRWSPWRWMQYACLKLGSTAARLHGDIFQKTYLRSRRRKNLDSHRYKLFLLHIQNARIHSNFTAVCSMTQKGQHSLMKYSLFFPWPIKCRVVKNTVKSASRAEQCWSIDPFWPSHATNPQVRDFLHRLCLKLGKFRWTCKIWHKERGIT